MSNQVMSKPVADKDVVPGEKELKRFLDMAYSSGNYAWGNLSLDEGGERRLACIAGWLTGLVHGGQEEIARRAAVDLWETLAYLGQYGGEEEVSTDRDGYEYLSPISVPIYKIVLGDDATFNGFSVGWYRRVDFDTIANQAKEIVGEEAGGYTYAILDQAKRKLGVNGNLTNTRYRKLKPSVWAADVDHLSAVDLYYRYSHNGGLLYHGPGKGENFSVLIGESQFWSIHT